MRLPGGNAEGQCEYRDDGESRRLAQHAQTVAQISKKDFS